jgi:hypothetical protein
MELFNRYHLTLNEEDFDVCDVREHAPGLQA